MNSSSSSNQKPKSCLPNDLILDEIVSRLSTEKILECKFVCTDWLKIIRSSRSFSEKHLYFQSLQFQHFTNTKYYPDNDDKGKNEISSTRIGFLVGIDEPPEEDGEFSMFYKEYNDGLVMTKKINHCNLFMASDMFIGSCNGLVCVCKHVFNKEVLYVFNPITREYVHLPEIASPESTSYRVSGFGFDATSGNYKAVRIVYPMEEKSEESFGLVQVYSLGTGLGWRDKETIEREFIALQPGLFLDKALHWLDCGGQIWAFDLETEKFHMVAQLHDTADGNSEKLRRELVVLGGWLTVLELYRNGVEIFSFKRTEKKQELRSWSGEFYIGYDDGEHFFIPFGLTNMGQLLCSVSRELICLCDKDAEHLHELEETPRVYFGMLHLNSFISLKELGELNVQVIESQIQ